MCAQSASNKFVNTCKGDSGSGVSFKLEEFGKSVHVIVAVTSGGLDCHDKLPGFYTKVIPYLDWIEKIVWK